MWSEEVSGLFECTTNIIALATDARTSLSVQHVLAEVFLTWLRLLKQKLRELIL
jgi:hypothetical protein